MTHAKVLVVPESVLDTTEEGNGFETENSMFASGARGQERLPTFGAIDVLWDFGKGEIFVKEIFLKTGIL